MKTEAMTQEKEMQYIGCRANDKLVNDFDKIAAASRRDRSNYLRLLMEYAIEKKIKL